jgi:hypothetical protein
LIGSVASSATELPVVLRKPPQSAAVAAQARRRKATVRMVFIT